MINKNLVSTLRRDVEFVWYAVIAVVFIGFAALAIGAAFIDFVPLHR
jgi:hypothetical protein